MSSKFFVRVLSALLLAGMLVVPTSRVDAALNEAIVNPAIGPYELVIVEVENCIYCDVLRRDVMPAYATSAEGRELPVRSRVDGDPGERLSPEPATRGDVSKKKPMRSIASSPRVVFDPQ